MDPSEIDGLDPGDVAATGLEIGDADPLSWFSWPSRKHRDAFARISEGWEGFLRGPNQCAKTHSAAAWSVAVCRRETHLDGVPLPIGEPRVVGGLLIPDYKTHSEASISAIKKVLGRWPHHFEMAGGNVQAIRIRQRDNPDPDHRTWSRLLVLVAQGTPPEGMRLDFAWGDEPPGWDYWDGIRGRGRANRPYPRVVTFTPLKKKEWEPIRNDIRGCFWPGNEAKRKFETHLSIDDNRFLSRDHKRGLEAQWAGTEYAEARLRGDYVDISGACPFQSADLNRYLSRARDPIRTEEIDLKDGIRVPVEVWADHEPGESYLITADPSSGAQDEKGTAGRYDPSCLYVISRITPRVVARFNGYVAAERLGRLGAILGRRYGNALLTWENNAGWGESFWIGARTNGSHYPNPYVQSTSTARHQPLSQRLGWTTTSANRGVLIGAVQTALSEDAIDLPSRAAIESLGDVRADHRGRYEAAAGRHDEDMICFGMAAYVLVTRPVRLPPVRHRVREDDEVSSLWRSRP